MRFAAIIAASAFAAFASAQNASTISSTSVAPTVTQTQQMPPIATAGFNPSNVTAAEKANWCVAERNSCPAICGGGYSQNRCDDTALTYSCVCYNGTVPDVTRYKQTLPFFICVETRRQCIATHPDDQAGQDTCNANAQCGTLDPPGIQDTPVTTTVATTTSRGSATSSTSSGPAATTTTQNAAITYSAELSTSAFAALIMAVFKFLL